MNTNTGTAASFVVVEHHGAAARVVLDRPGPGRQPLNILDLATIRELKARLEETLADETVRLVEIRGSKSFSAGVEIRDHFPERAPDMLREFHSLIRTVIYARCPTLAAVRGYCLGGGMELACACDFIVASADAQFGQPEIRVACFPPVAAVLLPRLIPEKKALEMILTGERIGAAEAHRLGLVNRVTGGVDGDGKSGRPTLKDQAMAFEAEVERFESALLGLPPGTLALARKAVQLGSRDAFESGLREAERIYLDELLKLPEAVEGLRAFLEKRPRG